MENRDKYWEKRNKTMIIWEYGILWTSLVPQMVKNLSAMCDTQIQSLGQEDLPLWRRGFFVWGIKIIRKNDLRIDKAI